MMLLNQINDKQKKEVERQLSIICRGVAEIIPLEAIKQKIISSVTSGQPLKVKLGLDYQHQTFI